MVEAPIRLSFHALDRLDSRLSLTPNQVIEILELGKTVPIGTETGKTRTHYLFYSIPDRQCFVAVIDDKDGTVVTVLPEDYHENLGWPISDESRKMAVNLSGERQEKQVIEYEEELVVSVKVAIESPAPRVFKVSGGIRGRCGSFKYVNLGSWPLEPYSGKIEKLMEDKVFLDHVRAVGKIKKADGTLVTLTIKIGKNGDGGIFNLEEEE